MVARLVRENTRYRSIVRFLLTRELNVGPLCKVFSGTEREAEQAD